MARKFFGTDGIRGRTNAGVMTAATAMKVGQAAGTYFQRGDHRHRVVIGKDTRLSGYMLENAMVAGFTSVGMDVVLLGPMPTPAIAHLTRAFHASAGIVISASHNPYYDNGIKFFGANGKKLADSVEAEIEGEELTTGFNPQFLLDGLTAIDGEFVDLSFTQATKPVVISGTDADDSSSFRYLLMPRRLLS